MENEASREFPAKIDFIQPSRRTRTGNGGVVGGFSLILNSSFGSRLMSVARNFDTENMERSEYIEQRNGRRSRCHREFGSLPQGDSMDFLKWRKWSSRSSMRSASLAETNTFFASYKWTAHPRV